MGMANIHSIRKSFQSLRFLCTQMPDPAKYVYSFSSSSTASSRALDSSREKVMSLQIEVTTKAMPCLLEAPADHCCYGLAQTSVPDLELGPGPARGSLSIGSL